MTALRLARAGGGPILLSLAAACAGSGAPEPVREPTPAPIAAGTAPMPPAPPPDSTRFERQILVEGSLEEPTELAVASDGRVFFTERTGSLKVHEPRTGETRTIARLDVFREDENGLIGIALDPTFQRTGWLYLNRTVGDTLHIRHRVARFTLAGDSIVDEKVLLEVPVTRGCCHTGGSMTFDDRGNLFVSFGDNTNPFATSYAPIDERPGRELWDARRSSANTKDLRGKILRITPRPDGSYGIPAGNLFADSAVGRPEIYTMGHRNPYRISVDRRTGFLYWGDVGPDARVDSIWGSLGYDEVGQARGAGNFGWPLFIADNKQYRARSHATGTPGEPFDPARPVNDSPNNTGARILPPAQPAFIWYPYAASNEFPLVGEGGRTAMAGPVYHFDDFAGSTARLPRHYDGKLVHYDWVRGWLRAVTMAPDGKYLAMEPFLDHLKFDHPSDVETGPDGSLYVLEYGTFWFARNPNARLNRIVYHPGNRPPQAEIFTTRGVGAAPHTVELSAARSFDHDPGDPLRFTWTFSDGGTAQGATVRRTFTEPGTYQARLVVTDREGSTAGASTEIRVGNDPPDVRIATEGNRSFFWDTATIRYRVEVSDREDGTLGSGIDPRSVRTTLEYLPRGLPGALAAGHQSAPPVPPGLALIQQSDCAGCHATDQASVGPSFRQIAERYVGRPDTTRYLARKIIAGGSGAWSDRVMPAHPTLRNDVAMEMVRYILSLAAPGNPLPPAGSIRLDRHAAGETGAYLLTATYVDRARNGIGPLETRRQVLLRAPVISAGDVTTSRLVGRAQGPAASGPQRTLATVFEAGAHLYLGQADLTGVGSIRLSLQSLGHDLTLELREGRADGPILATRNATAPARDLWFDTELPITVSGERDLYLVFRSGARDLGPRNPLVRVDTIRFERAGR